MQKNIKFANSADVDIKGMAVVSNQKQLQVLEKSDVPLFYVPVTTEEIMNLLNVIDSVDSSNVVKPSSKKKSTSTTSSKKNSSSIPEYATFHPRSAKFKTKRSSLRGAVKFFNSVIDKGDVVKPRNYIGDLADYIKENPEDFARCTMERLDGIKKADRHAERLLTAQKLIGDITRKGFFRAVSKPTVDDTLGKGITVAGEDAEQYEINYVKASNASWSDVWT